MRILVEITHPAHVHFFRNAISEFHRHGHEVAVTARKKDIALELLRNYGFEFTTLSKKGGGKFALAGELIVRDARLWRFCREFKPDVLTAIAGVSAAHVGFALRRPVVVWDDTEIATLSHIISYPFVSAVYTPDCYQKSLGRKHHRYPGCHELAYLHPDRFTPDIEIVKGLGINPAEKYCIIRFVSWQAHHDVGQHGLMEGKRLSFVDEIAKHARPYITSESPLPKELELYRLDIPAHQIHHVLAFAGLYVGEGATMASEAAVLGVPAVYVSTLKAGNMDMFEGYGLLKQTTDTDQALQYALDWLGDPKTTDNCAAAREKILAEKIDVTAFVVEVIEQRAGKP